ncbi:MAG: hypothetical protein IAE91_00935 [Ignavibacteriaceae bacterium]|nr:hypothetical protein [Ignavibacteriaceae bacterium]
MKVLLLSDIRSVHTLKWANSLQEKGIEVIVFGLLNKNCEKFHPEIKIFSHNIASEIAEKEESGIRPWPGGRTARESAPGRSARRKSCR